MESDGASGLWLFAVLGGPAILAVALIYGAWQWRHRRRRLDTLREDATRANYKTDIVGQTDASKSDETRF